MRYMMHGMMLLLASLLITQEARAGVIFQTGFETPKYSVGQLAGQDGWYGSTAPVVQTSTVFSGSQAAEFDSALDTRKSGFGQSYDAQSLAYNSVGNPDPLVRFQSEFFVSLAGTASNWDPIAIIANNGYLAQIIVQANDVISWGVGSTAFSGVTVARGQWNSFEVDINFATDIGTGYLNGNSLGSGAFSSQVTSL